MESSQNINQSETGRYLGFLDSVQHEKPSLVCDFMELYRYMRA
ncbi:MAG: CRISPR-associated endonuclease Cas1 [Bacteroidales bacterium]|nr:CRISPR-associated endonuclease Cas1 [Bacteroidales bacterium]